MIAVAKLVKDWLTGKTGTGAPTAEWEREVIGLVNDYINEPCRDEEWMTENAESSSIMKDEITRVYDDLVKLNVPGHLRLTTSHRKWVRLSYEFWVKVGVKFSGNISKFIQKHDLSKYTHREVLGYSIMFGDGTGFKNLTAQDEQDEWQNTLHNHYAANPHHPEYFYPEVSAGERNKSIPILELDPENGKDYLDESLFDMLGCVAERRMRDEKTFTLSKWLDIEDRFLLRYGESDKKYVKDKIEEWKQIALEFMELKTNRETIQGHFGDQEIIWGKTE